LEELEPRTLLTAYAPDQIRHAYGFDKLPYDGSGQTIAIVVAHDNPALTYDLAEFDQLFGLPDPVLTIAQPQGQPSYDEGWGLEIDLDVEWAHAIAPAANILLVEAKTTFLSSLLSAVDYARNQPGVVVVSMSWAYHELLNESRYDSHFTTPSGHIGGSGLPGGITFVAASGDYGAGAVWPAASPNVLSIGGTTLTLDDQSQIASETGWTDSGGGVSNYEPQPAYQVPFQTTYAMRTTPDFSYDADSTTAYWIYDSSYGGTTAIYGTSAGTPQWAALIALADQGLAMNNIGSLDGPTQTIAALYNLANVSYATYYYDITDGNNGYQAGPGYDLVTGIGSPVADQVVQGLVNGARAPSGGARRPRGSAIDLVPEAGLTSRAIPLASLPQLEAATAPLGTTAKKSLRGLPLLRLAESGGDMSDGRYAALTKDREKDATDRPVPPALEAALGTASSVANRLPGP
jgi:subtilase family serine protease